MKQIIGENPNDAGNQKIFDKSLWIGLKSNGKQKNTLI